MSHELAALRRELRAELLAEVRRELAQQRMAAQMKALQACWCVVVVASWVVMIALAVAD